MTTALDIRNLHASVANQPILKGIDLVVKQGEVHALMGPNGSGKSTLAYTLAGHPTYESTAGQVIFGGEICSNWTRTSVSARACSWRFSIRSAVPGVTLANFLAPGDQLRAGRRLTRTTRAFRFPTFRKLMKEKMELLGMDHNFAGRYLNEGFSGGEKKRAEILQMATVEPKIAILDETDSGPGY